MTKTSNTAPSTAQVQPKAIPFKDFLENVHPSIWKELHNVWSIRPSGIGPQMRLETPDLRLHCQTCDGERTFRTRNDVEIRKDANNGRFLEYQCGDCQKQMKLFSLLIIANNDVGMASGYKYGEAPPFGVPVPKKVLQIFGNDKDNFLKGRQCENQGLGVGAFAYYRRVVENHKDEIIDRIIAVCETLNASHTLIEELREAKKEISFTKAIDQIKQGLPQGLLIRGHNPLSALHGALSNGLHAGTDQECLEAAHAVRLVITDLAEKMHLLRQEDTALHNAVQLLLTKKA